MRTPDNSKRYTLPSQIYSDAEKFDRMRDELFRKHWTYIGNTDQLRNHTAVPVELLPGFLDEPLLMTRNANGDIRAMGNVCTHRGNILVAEPSKDRLLRCTYHGRCFGLDGMCRSMPGLEHIPDFPAAEDHLTHLSARRLGNMLFARMDGDLDFAWQFGSIRTHMSWFPYRKLSWREEQSRDYVVNAHWMLYVENYLEGLHVQYVHPGLSAALDPDAYDIDLFDYASLQLGVAQSGEDEIFTLPPDSQWNDQRIYAFYWFVFPNIMLNYYPWGISLNVVEPMGLRRTRIRFITFTLPGKTPDLTYIHQTELEDERVVESVQRGVLSSFYDRGQYMPGHESAVRHFHGLVQKMLDRPQD